MDGAVLVAEHGSPEIDLLHQAGDAGHGDDVSLAILILDDDEEARDDVLDERLRAEADRDAEHSSAGEDRRDVDAELRESREPGDRPDDDYRRLDRYASDRLEPLGQLDRATLASAAGSLDGGFDRLANHPLDE